jgi:hypothetical protein
MVQRVIKIPKHGGPDGVGLPETAFLSLVELINSKGITDNQITQAMELCLSASTQDEWNNKYRPQLVDLLK